MDHEESTEWYTEGRTGVVTRRLLRKDWLSTYGEGTNEVSTDERSATVGWNSFRTERSEGVKVDVQPNGVEHLVNEVERSET